MNFKNTLLDTLGMKVIQKEKDLVIIDMPVDERTKQPAGFLHGGASVALAETAASIGALLHVDPKTTNIFGIEINANHIKSVREGMVRAKAKPIHIGKSTMVWEINIHNEQ